jgi:hypothetical protein
MTAGEDNGVAAKNGNGVAAKDENSGAVIGIRRETINAWERRAPISPDHVRQLVSKGIRVLVQPMNRRVHAMWVSNTTIFLAPETGGHLGGVQGVQNVPRSAWEKIDAAS